MDNFNDALLSFKQFAGFPEAKTTPEFKNINYNIGYAYFKLKEYEQAGNSFQAYVEAVKDDKVRLNDAYLRLGDSRFVTAKYWPAMEAYNKSMEMKGIDADYAAFQKLSVTDLWQKMIKRFKILIRFCKFIQNPNIVMMHCLN